MSSTGRPTISDQKTPRTDEWVALVRPLFEQVGSRSEFARFVAGPKATHGEIVRWTNVIARWLRREALPSLEQYYLVTDWLNARAQKPKGRKASNKKTRTAPAK